MAAVLHHALEVRKASAQGTADAGEAASAAAAATAFPSVMQ